MGEIGYLFNLIFTYPIFNGLMLLYQLFGDMGLSIIVLTLVIRLILFPLTLQQLKSMKATQALQPRMAEIRKKHKDQQSQAMAMQALYKEYGINPMAGCLPLVVQLPVLYGLFYALNNVLRLPSNLVTAQQKLSYINHLLYPFVPQFRTFPNIDLNWFTFLNPTWHFSLGAPDPTHILPILAGIATFVSMRMSMPKTQAANANDPSTQTTKTMQYMMPLITVFFGWSFAAGLALYWTVSSIFQAVQQFFVTGWGALLTTPNILKQGTSSNNSNSNGTSKTYAGDERKEQEVVQQAEESGSDDGESEGAIGRQLRTAQRRRPSGASARRRSSNSQRRRVSRS